MVATTSAVNHILRSPIRVLNHMGLIHKKLEIAKKWALIWTNSKLDSKSLKIREAILSLQKGQIDVQDALRQIQDVNHLQDGDIFEDLLTCYPTGLLEFHPTDVCDLSCRECHYRNKENATIPFSEVDRLIKNLAPRAITVTGGGEPNVYKSESKNMNDLILKLKQVLPDTELGLINNNTHIPTGNWTNYVTWQRTSVDAFSRITYLYLKGVDKFDKTVQNVKHLFHDTAIPFVGIGFLYRKENVAEIKDFLVYWFEWFKNQHNTIQQRFNIQFRPVSPSIERVEAIRRGDEIFLEKDIEQKLSEEICKVLTFSNTDSEFQAFLVNNTNFHSMIPIEGTAGTGLHVPKSFENCYNALIHRVLRANGDEYPDFLLCNFPELMLGNTLHNNQNEERVKIALLQFFYFSRECSFCSGEICRQGWVSQIVEDYLRHKIEQDSRLSKNYFF
jgi:molybdenum cofactor biosynthesis enzyme MoaA